MARLNKYIKYQSISGDPVIRGDTVVTPISSALSISLPFFGFVWNRPSALIVDSKDGTQKVPIVDLTRVAQLGILTMGFLISALVWLIKR
jgi:hypothetical protein